ncbi:hypothetical protein [Priestia megaterium]|uniref:hypothetical protein n=1 Tax=Priestia megaterium TaxID=1404 RepID=UPI002FFFD1FB
MNNPIELARKQLEVSVKEFALLCNLHRMTIRSNEAGDEIKPSPRILSFLATQGFNEEQIEVDYQRFREWKREQLAKKVLTK